MTMTSPFPKQLSSSSDSSLVYFHFLLKAGGRDLHGGRGEGDAGRAAGGGHR